MISQVKVEPNPSIRALGLTDRSIPPIKQSNPLILEMSRSAGCEATGQTAPIRKDGGI